MQKWPQAQLQLERVEDLAAQMPAAAPGAGFDAETDWNEREQVFKMAGRVNCIAGGLWLLIQKVSRSFNF